MPDIELINKRIQRNSENNDIVSIVVPTYQEAENLRPLITRIHSVMSIFNRAYEVIIVDDNSQDGTDGVIIDLVNEGYPVKLITRIDARGLSSAVVRGFLEARGYIFVCMDADLSHPPEKIPQLIECIEDDGWEFVIGSRYVPGASTEEAWGALRWLNSKIAILLALPFSNAKDPMSGFFALPRNLFERADSLDPVGYKIGLELIVKCSCKKIHEVPIHFTNRVYGQSKLTLKEQYNYLKHLKRLVYYKYSKIFRC
jgi:dolichol-phosphate mannosyltransferase